jgi:hypothetical protein
VSPVATQLSVIIAALLIRNVLAVQIIVKLIRFMAPEISAAVIIAALVRNRNMNFCLQIIIIIN